MNKQWLFTSTAIVSRLETKTSYNKINKKLLRGCPIFVKTIFKFGLMMVAGLKYDIGR